MGLSTEYCDFRGTASASTGRVDFIVSCWEALGYELVPEAGWADEDAVLGQPDVQEALREGLRELRALREARE